MRFIGYALTQCLKIYATHHSAVFVLKSEDLSKYRLQVGDTEGLVNHALSIRGVICAILLKEQEDFVKISMRSVGDFPVNVLAGRYFNGGGHRKAAGGSLRETLSQVVERVDRLLAAEKGHYTRLIKRRRKQWRVYYKFPPLVV